MAGLDDRARIALESCIDDTFKDLEGYEESVSLILREQGIEPDLESILSFIAGFLNGLAHAYYLREYDRPMNDIELDDLSKIMKRRAWELRQAFMSTRVEK